MKLDSGTEEVKLDSGTEEVRLDSGGSRELSRHECRELLSSAGIGRIVFTDRALPAVQPVTFCLDGEEIVIRTMAGSKLATAASGTVVAFEADEFDAETRTGWSVTVVGHARAVYAPEEIVRLEGLPLAPWTPGGRDYFITIRTGQISGLRVRHGDPLG
ncbi:pyridoxamine 5'-phosphate oxidase family protein [Streptosporangium sp. NPDC051023]|uniref:pyridoxamine 5'-phosphate oxidase family protein n=1 Tax=Streptosporangium sp. NPDC051023 TaxID=3155410 RepID=UPI0034501D2C